MITQKYLDELTYEIIGSAIEVQKALGRGLLESIYHLCIKEELSYRKINFITEMKVPVITDFRCDLFIEDCMVVELKTVSEFIPIHEAQLLTYMKLLKAPKGILLNFNSFNIFKVGQKTFVNEYFSKLPKY